MPGLKDRLGLLPSIMPRTGGPSIWLHAVSLGEAKVANFLAERLRSHLPGATVAITSSTRTGWEEARRSAAPGDIVFYAPFDYGWICRRFLRTLKPDVVVVLETELWPNLFREAKRAGAGLLLVNGRISDRSMARYRATRFFWRRVLVYPDAFFVQSDQDAERFRAIGAPTARVHVSGNLKFAVRPSTTPLAESLPSAIGERNLGPVLVAGSTMPGEERFLIEAFAALCSEFPALWMILAPRHPERSAEVAAAILASGIPMELRSEWQPGKSLAPGIFLLDTTGELASLYQLATVAYIGGTLVPTGGHNLLEPAQFGCPTIIGPSMENFAEIAREFLEAPATGPIPGAPGIRCAGVIQVPNPADLTIALRYLFQNPAFARRVGESGRQVAARRAGDLKPVLAELEIRVAAKAGRPSAPDARPQAAAAGAGPWGQN
jgi:3-deoxy-D-manno-octulosonic-acid transferase